MYILVFWLVNWNTWDVHIVTLQLFFLRLRCMRSCSLDISSWDSSQHLQSTSWQEGGGGICADLKAVALWEVDGPEGSVTGVPNSMYLVTGKTLNNSSQFYTLSITWFWLFTNFEIRTEFSLGSELSVSILQCPENSQMFTCETRLKSSDCLLFYSNVNFFPSSCRHTTELYSIHGLQKYWM